MGTSVYASPAIVNKVEEISRVMQAEGIWNRSRPGWVDSYGVNDEMSVGFFDWIQFVYLPNKVICPTGAERHSPKEQSFIMLQAKRYAEDGKLSNRLRQLLVELDALL